MTKSKIFLYFCLSFIGGIFLNSVISVSQLLMLGFLILGILLISVFWQYPEGKPLASNGAGKKLVVVGFCFLFLAVGIWRHELAQSKIIYPEEKNIAFVGTVASELDIRANNIKLTVKPVENSSQPIAGKVLVTTNRYPEYQYGDKLKITGKLQVPEEVGDFDYPGYLTKEGIYSVMYWPQIERAEKSQDLTLTQFTYKKILDFKGKLRESIYQNLSPPQSSILGAIILGDKRKISEEWKQKLNVAGVRHITAISGMHVAILTTILMSALVGLGLWRQQAFYLTILIITVFIIMTGFQSSAIRSGIMAGFFLLAQHLGRQNLSSRAIIFAATGILTVNPLLLRLDVGFQLSFLAMMGIIYLLSTFRDWLKFIPFKSLKNILAMTFSAYLFTLPILIYNFGYFSAVAPITNVLIVPLLPVIMISGFIFAISGIIWQPLGWILSWLAWILLTYLKIIVDWFSSITLAFLTIQNLHWVWLIAAYLILGYLTWRVSQGQKLKFLNY